MLQIDNSNLKLHHLVETNFKNGILQKPHNHALWSGGGGGGVNKHEIKTTLTFYDLKKINIYFI